MRNTKSNSQLTQNAKAVNGWTDCLSEAQEKLRHAESYVGRLKIAVRTFKKFIESKEPFPGSDQPTNV